MALVNIKQKEVLAVLEKDLLETIKNDKFVNVHIHSNTLSVSHCIIPDDIIIDDYIMITQGNFEINIDLENVHTFDIIYDEIDNGYHIKCDDMSLYFDFNI